MSYESYREEKGCAVTQLNANESAHEDMGRFISVMFNFVG